MKTAAFATLLFLSAVSSTSVSAHNYYYRSYNSNNVITGVVVGTAYGALLANARQSSVAHPYPRAVYAQPVAPYLAPTTAPYPYYSQPRACETVRVPVYDTGGRLIEYVQQCAN